MPVLRTAAILISFALLFSSPSLAQPQKKNDLAAIAARKFSIAHGCMAKRLYPEAVVRWQEFIKLYPKHAKLANAYHHLGVCQIQTQQFPAAAGTFRALLKQFPKSDSRDSAQLNLGTALYHQASKTNKPADFDAAAKEFGLFQTTFAKSPLAPRALYYQAECFCLSGKAQTALPIYNRILKSHAKSPLVPQVMYALAATQQDLKQDAAAIGTLQGFLKSYGKHALADDCRLRLGLSFFETKKYALAAPLFSQLAKNAKFPYADLAQMKYAHTLFETEKFPLAAAQYELLTKKFPKSAYVGPALLAAGKSRFRAKQFPQGLSSFAALAGKKLPESTEGAFWQAKTLIQLKKFPDALRILDKLVPANAKHPLIAEMTFGRGEALAGIPKREKESVAVFVAFGKTYPKHELAADATYRAAMGSHNLNNHSATRQYTASFLANKLWAQHALVSEVLFLQGESHLRGVPQVIPQAETSYRRLIKEFPQSRFLTHAQLGLAACLHATAKHQDVVSLLAVARTWKDPAQKAEAGLLVGRSLLATKQPKPAIAALQQAQKDHPKWQFADEVLLVLGLAYRDAKDPVNSTSQLQALLSKYPKSPFRDHAFYQLAEYDRLARKYPTALTAYQNSIVANKAGRFAPLSQLGTASIQYEQGKLPQSVAACSAILTQYPKSPASVLATAKYLRGMAQQQLGKFAEGATDLQAFLASKPGAAADIVGARFALSRCQVGLKQYGPAIATLQSILKQSPKYARTPDVYYELAFALQANNKPQLAANAFRDLATRFPQHSLAAESWYRFAEYAEKQSRLPDALAASVSAFAAWQVQDKALKGKPGHPQIQELGEKIAFRRGLILLRLKKYDESIAILTAQRVQFPQGRLQMSARFFVGEGRFHKKEFQKALACYQAVSASKDKVADAHRPACLYRGGLCGVQLKDWKASEQLFQTLIRQFPKFPQCPDARYGLGLAQQNQNKIKDAMKAFQDAIASSPNSEVAAKSWFMLGQCSFAQKDYKSAIKAFTEVAFGFEHPVWQPLSYFEAGRCYIQLKDLESARKMFNALMKEFPQHARTKDAQTILANLK